MKTFIGISTETKDNKLVYITTSTGESLYNDSGITFNAAIDFLFNLIYKREHRKNKVAFVSYGFARDNEFIFSTMDKDLKDKLFQSFRVKQEINRLEFENEQLDNILFNSKTDNQEYEVADFERYVNGLTLKELIKVEFDGYNISLANGKRLTIRKKNKSISIYDILGFFKPDNLNQSLKKWLGYDVPILNKKIFAEFPQTVDTLKIRCNIEAGEIAKLASKLDTELKSIGINLARYHGATAVTSWLLTKSKAKTFYHNYRYKRQISSELTRAAYQSYYGGRAEQFKLGTLENVNIYDINSAYAFAASFLPVLLTKPRFVKDFENEPFSLWFCEYDLTSVNPYFGFIPNRNNSGVTQYKTKGKGYFWLPEIQWLIMRHPECIKIHKGFIWDYERAPFTDYITELYNIRVELKQAGNPLQGVLKKALQSVYGKFLQHQGRGHFFNLFYAGFICSFVRRMLLDATAGCERETICFLTDAIHTTADLDIPCTDNLGEFRKESFDKVTYLDNGVYQCYNDGEIVKTKNKGSKTFDFQAALNQINKLGSYSADNSIFVGHNLFSLQQFNEAKYLEDVELNKVINPIENAPRLFPSRLIDFEKDFIDSSIVELYGGKESALYTFNEFTSKGFSLDLINAKRG